MILIKKLIADVLMSVGFSIRDTRSLLDTEALSRSAVLLELLAASNRTKDLGVREALALVRKSKSQMGQDVLALSMLGLDYRGYFVEFGATNGVELSNTFLLEKEFGWSGILCEPARNWHSELKLNRSCAIDTRCVFSTSGQNIEFSETTDGTLSTISTFYGADANRLRRKTSELYQVETVTLADLLASHQAPTQIDFLSIDTEGSEFEILRNFDFSKYKFGIICVEHNFTENQKRIQELLTRNGYVQVFPEFSRYDDWYVRNNS